MTLIKYDHLQVLATIPGKFHQNGLKTVGGVVEARLCLRKDGRTQNYSPLRLTLGGQKKPVHSKGQSFDSVFMELFQNVHLHEIGASLGQGNKSSIE